MISIIPSQDLMLVVPSEDATAAPRFLFAQLWQRVVVKPEVPSSVLPTSVELKQAGLRRPTWLALIAFFFSPRFLSGFLQSSLWPMSLYIPEPYLPITFLSMITYAIYERRGR